MPKNQQLTNTELADISASMNIPTLVNCLNEVEYALHWHAEGAERAHVAFMMAEGHSQSRDEYLAHWENNHKERYAKLAASPLLTMLNEETKKRAEEGAQIRAFDSDIPAAISTLIICRYPDSYFFRLTDKEVSLASETIRKAGIVGTFVSDKDPITSFTRKYHPSFAKRMLTYIPSFN